MLGIDRKTLETVWTLFLFGLVIFVAFEIRRVILLFALAIILAHLLSPLVNLVSRRMPKDVPRIAALAIVYVSLIGAIAVVMVPLGSRLSTEATSLANRLPDVLHSDPLSRLPVPQRFESFRPEVTEFVQQRMHELSERIGPMLTQAGTRIISGFGAVLAVVLIPIFAFFFLKDGPEMRDAFVEMFPAHRHALLSNLLDDLHLLLAQYIRSLVILSIAAFTCYSIFLAATGAPYPILLSGFAAAAEFIPAVGPFVAGLTIVIGSAVAGYSHVLALVIFLIVYRIFQDYVLSPHLLSSSLNLHPMLVLFGVLAGDALAGIPGMFFSVPVMAALRMIVLRLRRRRSASRQ